MEKTKASLEEVSASILSGLMDDDMQKAKSIKEVLKSAEKLFPFANACSVTLSNFDELSDAISKLESKHDKAGMKQIIEKVKTAMQIEEATAEQKEDEEMDGPESLAETTDKKKKKKKKKKKGKK